MIDLPLSTDTPVFGLTLGAGVPDVTSRTTKPSTTGMVREAAPRCALATPRPRAGVTWRSASTTPAAAVSIPDSSVERYLFRFASALWNEVAYEGYIMQGT